MPGAASNAFPAMADENMRHVFEREIAKLQQHQQQQQAAQAQAQFPNFSSLMALQQQVLNGAQDLSLAAAAAKDIKLNGQRSSLEHSAGSSSCSKDGERDDAYPSSLHGRKSEEVAHPHHLPHHLAQEPEQEPHPQQHHQPAVPAAIRQHPVR